MTNSNSHQMNNIKYHRSFTRGVKRYRRGKLPKYQIGLEKDWGTKIAAYNSGFGAVKGGKNHQQNNKDHKRAFKNGVKRYNAGLKCRYQMGLKKNYGTSIAAHCSGYGAAHNKSLRVDISKGTVDGVRICSEVEADIVKRISRKTGKVPDEPKLMGKLYHYSKPVKGYHYFEV